MDPGSALARARLSGTTKLVFRFKCQTADTRPRSRGTTCPRLAFRCPSKGREQGMPDARCTRGLVCKVVQNKAHTSIQGSGGDPTFPAQWLYGLYRALPGISGFAASVACRKPALRPGWAFAPPTDLMPTTEASEPHDFAVHRSTVRRHALGIAHGVYPALRSHRAHDAAASTASHPSVR